MASGSRVHLDASQQPEYYVKSLTPESADTASQLLQVNHEKHHIFFNQSGFHVSDGTTFVGQQKGLTCASRITLRIIC